MWGFGLVVCSVFAEEQVLRSMEIRVEEGLATEVGEESGVCDAANTPSEAQQAAEHAEHEAENARAANCGPKRRPLGDLTNTAAFTA